MLELKYFIVMIVSCMVNCNYTTRKTLCAEDKLGVRKAHVECVDTANTKPGLVLKLKGGDWSEEDPTLMEWVLCVMHKVGMMTMEGVIPVDSVLKNIPPNERDDVEQIIDTCIPKQSNAKTAVRAWLYAKCFYTILPNYSAIC